MPVTPQFRKGLIGRIAVTAGLLMSLGMWGGCLMDPSSDDSGVSTEADPASGSKALRDQSPVQADGVPRGCTREWSETARDSVLFCPDIRPPSPIK
ncbi:MAG: hypothetical protein JWP91_3194 [Fibrobacteres bacterium]|nr:hypothetical protein [Fibrobacterota bacterium]